MLFDYQMPIGNDSKDMRSNAMQGYPSAQSYDSPSSFIGLGPVQLGSAQRQRLNRQYDGLMSQVGQQAVNSGLYNTTVPITQRQSVERARGQALTGLEGQLMDEELGAYTGMTGDALLSQLQNRLARTSELDSATQQGIVDNISNVLDQIAFLESKNEKGPNLDKLREIVSLLGQSMADQNASPSLAISYSSNDNEKKNEIGQGGSLGFSPLSAIASNNAFNNSMAAGARRGDIKADVGLARNVSGSMAGGSGISSPYPSFQSHTDAGLRFKENSLGNIVAIGPDSKDFETDEAYRDAVDAYNEFNKLFPMASSEDITEAAKKLGIDHIGKFLAEDFGKFLLKDTESDAPKKSKPSGGLYNVRDEISLADNKRKRDSRPRWQKSGFPSEKAYIRFLQDDDDSD